MSVKQKLKIKLSKNLTLLHRYGYLKSNILTEFWNKMAAKIHFTVYCIFDPDAVAFVLDPSLFNVNKKQNFLLPIFTQKRTNF